MADKSTFIKLDRNILYWRWFQNSKILHVFLWLLLKANIKDGFFEKDTIQRGSLATSNASIAQGCGLTIDNVRTALANLEETGEITRKSRNHYQVITINNYELYQSAIGKSGGQIPSNTDGKSQATAIANPNNQRIYKNGKNGKKEKEEDGLVFDSPIGKVKRGTDAFRSVSHLILKPEEGTVDDIPMIYRDQHKTFAEYSRSRNQ